MCGSLPYVPPLTTATPAWIRPRNGLVPGAEGSLLGKRLRKAIAFGEPVLPQDCE